MVALRSLIFLWIISAFAAAQSNPSVQLTNTYFNGITIGMPFTLTWEPSADSVTITLNNGSIVAQNLVYTIVSDAKGGSYVWTPVGISPGYYNLAIFHGEDTPNYSFQFYIAANLNPTATVPLPSGTPTASASINPTAFSTDSATPTPASSSHPSSHALSTGAKAGIGVGAGVGAILIVGAISFLVWRRRRDNASELEKDVETQNPKE